MNLSLPKECLIASSQQYKHIFTVGKRLRGKDFSLIFSKNRQNHDRLGISVSGKKLAVDRNRIKRLLKEFYRHNRSFPTQVAGNNDSCCQGFDLVVATYKGFIPQGLHDIEQVLGPYCRLAP